MARFRFQLGAFKIPAALAVAAAFFLLYNRYILNANLQNLRSSLTILDSAAGIGQAEAALLLVDEALVSQMAGEKLNLQALAVIEYAHGTLSGEDRQRPVDDARKMLAVLAEDEASGRPEFLTALDGIASGVRNMFNRTRMLPRRLGEEPRFAEIDEKRLEEAARLERRGQMAEAVERYESLLKEYPHYSGRAGLKLRLASLLLRTRAQDRADQLAREALGEASTVAETEAAQVLIKRIQQADSQGEQVRTLQVQMATLEDREQRQETGFQLGSLLIKLYDMEEAAWAFNQAAKAAPDGKLALSSLFKEAWCLRYLGRLEEAAGRFQEVIRSGPKSRWAAAAYQQIAEIYKSTGDYTSAVDAYQKSSEESPDAALSAVALTQAGLTQQFDLKATEQARETLGKVVAYFPASPMAPQAKVVVHSAGGTVPDAVGLPGSAPVVGGKPGAGAAGIPTALAPAQAPAIQWLEGFLPTFVDVFMERLSKYMLAVDEAEISRKFSEREFQDLLTRRVQQRFPGQISQMVTRIHSDGFAGSGTIRLGAVSFPVSAKIGITVADEKTLSRMKEVKIGPVTLPDPLLKALEDTVNAAIQRQRYPLVVKHCTLREGFVEITVQRKR